jgi:hypothetical protein
MPGSLPVPAHARGKAFSKLNGWKGGRPKRSTYPFPVGQNWQPDMSDPNFVRCVLIHMRKEYRNHSPSGCDVGPSTGSSWRRKKVVANQLGLLPKKGKAAQQEQIVLITNEIPGSVLEQT